METSEIKEKVNKIVADACLINLAKAYKKEGFDSNLIMNGCVKVIIKLDTIPEGAFIKDDSVSIALNHTSVIFVTEDSLNKKVPLEEENRETKLEIKELLKQAIKKMDEQEKFDGQFPIMVLVEYSDTEDSEDSDELEEVLSGFYMNIYLVQENMLEYAKEFSMTLLEDKVYGEEE